jgi:hypothetical protein
VLGLSDLISARYFAMTADSKMLMGSLGLNGG